MNLPEINWRDVLSVGAAIVSLTASAMHIHDRRQERRERRRRAEDHRRAATAALPDQLEHTDPQHTGEAADRRSEEDDQP